MRRCVWTLALILLGCGSGCINTGEGAGTSWIARLQKQTVTPDHALLTVALLECPIGDDYINRQVWEHTDQMLGSSESRRALQDNGLRVGQLVGTTPDGFQKLLLSPQSCSNPKAMVFPSGRTATIWLGPILPQSTYEIVAGDTRTDISFDQARYGLDVTATFTSTGQTKLTFTPKVENGEAALPFESVPERSAWERRTERAARTHPELRFEVTLDANQYVLIGGRAERTGSLGLNAFTQGPPQIQRLLVIRNCRSVSAREAHENSVEELLRTDRTLPLALQATIPASRAKSH